MENNAAEQLAAISDVRASVADRLVTPIWYHPVLGLALAGYVVGIGLGGKSVQLVVGLLFALTAVLLTKVYREATGVWVSGYGAGRASRWAVALGVLVGSVVLTSWATATYTEARWQIPVLALAGLAGTIILGRGFDSALRAQLRSGS